MNNLARVAIVLSVVAIGVVVYFFYVIKDFENTWKQSNIYNLLKNN